MSNPENYAAMVKQLMGNQPGNAAVGQAGIANMPLHQQLAGGVIGGSAYAQAQPPRSVANNIKQARARYASKDKILEYIEAQLNMDLFKADPIATTFFQSAMAAAVLELSKLT